MDVNMATPVQPVGPGGGRGSDAGPGGGKKDEHQEDGAQHGHTDPATSVSGLLSMEGLTPEAQHALERLAGEVDTLRRQLTHTQQELAQSKEREFRDAVAPALNRRGFLAELEHLINRLGIVESRPALILVHLINGEDIRRTHGLEALDRALALACGVLEADQHQAMLVGNLGGNDFAVVVLEDGIEGARRKAAELEAALHATHTEQHTALQARTGLALVEPGMTAEAALAAADRDFR